MDKKKDAIHILWRSSNTAHSDRDEWLCAENCSFYTTISCHFAILFVSQLSHELYNHRPLSEYIQEVLYYFVYKYYGKH